MAPIFTFVLAMAVAAQLGDQPSGDEEALAVERAVVRQRLQLRSGELTVVRSRWIGNGPDREEIRSRLRIAFDNEKLRFDQQIEPGAGLPTVTAKTVLTPGRVLFHSNDIHPGNKRMAAAMGDRDQMKAYELGAFDPRLLGILPFTSSVLHGFDLLRFIARPDRSETKVSPDAIDGEDALRIEYVRMDGFVVRLWVSRLHENVVLRSELEGPHPVEGVVVDRVINKPRRFDTDLWFPERVVHQREVAGTLVQQEDLLVESARFNHEVDPKTFEFSGMDVPPGTPIFETPPDPRGARIWNGQEITYAGTHPIDPALSPSASRSGSI